MSMTTVRGWPSSSYFIQGLFFIGFQSKSVLFLSIAVGIVEVLDSYAQFDHLGLVASQFISFYQKRVIFLMKEIKVHSGVGFIWFS